MKAIIEFNLPEEQSEFDLATHSLNYSVIIQDILNHLRSTIKYDEKAPQEVVNYADELSGLIHQMLIDAGINPYN